jgi:hypothetical protein
MKQLLIVAAIFTLRILIYNGQAIAATVYVHPALANYNNIKPVKTYRPATAAPAKGKTAGIKIKQGQ